MKAPRAFHTSSPLVLVDTSALFALMDRRDVSHRSVASFLQAFRQQKVRLLVTNFVIAETHALTVSRLGAHQGRLFLTNASQGMGIIRVDEADEARARQIILAHEDKDYTYTDATSFAVMERFDIMRAFTFDRHFIQYGFQTVP